MRAFISLNLSGETVSVLKSFQNSVKEELGYADSKNVRWESPDKFHITMFFIGDINEDRIEELKASIGNISKENIGEISLELGKLNGFPDLNRPRVLFVEVNEQEYKLKRLSKAVNNVMKDFGFDENNKFHAHITLGRVKRDCRIKKPAGLCLTHNFKIKELNLMKSTLNSDGAVHESLFSAEF